MVLGKNSIRMATGQSRLSTETSRYLLIPVTELELLDG